MAMAAVIGEVTPYALAIAMSPSSVIVTILLLSTSRARAAVSAFLAGRVSGIVLGSGVFAALASFVELYEVTPTWADWARLGLGLVLLPVGVQLWWTPGDEAQPAWLPSLNGASPVRAMRLGLLLSAASPKTVLLAAAGGLAIGAADLSITDTAVAVAVFTAIAAVTVALPLVLHVLLAARIHTALDRARRWLSAHSGGVMAVGISATSIVLVAQGVAGLSHG
ncbi:Sap-like sulfolipid-1-addressing protein [Blastococcus xanthinilyticus]|uniref:Sap-like sulfolipid-1-addressing protein n=2 Tax=Blastococcus xanthinilyticus TaxID=1564164 RepID=A0A5S5CPI7_9ACTN|nr:Sap-like sulfolipid-1-addressing protein [Blastococcus xanthinilyticus]